MFFKEPLTECFFVEPKMVLLWIKHLYLRVFSQYIVKMLFQYVTQFFFFY